MLASGAVGEAAAGSIYGRSCPTTSPPSTPRQQLLAGPGAPRQDLYAGVLTYGAGPTLRRLRRWAGPRGRRVLAQDPRSGTRT
jgi:hypothetical protein